MTGDSIQFYGVGRYGCQVYAGLDPYYESIAKLKAMISNGTIENIIISHDYVPVKSFSFGKENSLTYMDTAKSCIDEIKDYTIEQYENGVTSASQIQSSFIAFKKSTYPNFPTASLDIVIGKIINTYCK